MIKKYFTIPASRQFFTIYQIVSHKTHLMEIEEVSTGIKNEVKDETEFKQWVKNNYPMYINSLENYN